MIFPLVSCCSCVNNIAVLKATELLVFSSRSDYMTLLLNRMLYATGITKLGSSQYTARNLGCTRQVIKVGHATSPCVTHAKHGA